MNGGVTSGGPATAAIDEFRVIHFADEKLAGLIRGALHLNVALEAEIIVALGEKLAIDRTVWIMAGGAAFAHGFVLVNEGP